MRQTAAVVLLLAATADGFRAVGPRPTLHVSRAASFSCTTLLCPEERRRGMLNAEAQSGGEFDFDAFDAEVKRR
jgi:hypothetical protein